MRRKSSSSSVLPIKACGARIWLMEKSSLTLMTSIKGKLKVFASLIATSRSGEITLSAPTRRRISSWISLIDRAITNGIFRCFLSSAVMRIDCAKFSPMETMTVSISSMPTARSDSSLVTAMQIACVTLSLIEAMIVSLLSIPNTSMPCSASVSAI